MKHLHRWISSLMYGLVSELDEDTLSKILVECGRNCVSKGFIRKTKSVWQKSRDLDYVIESINESWGDVDAKVWRENDVFFARYGECFCPLVNDFRDVLPSSWCECSKGWLLELFESVFENVDVTLHHSVKRGGHECKFSIIVNGSS